MVDRATGDNPADWTAFDINNSLRMLKVGSEPQLLRELRKLHLRWWHAGRSQMEKVLHAAGVPPRVLSHVANVVDTCRECRAWKKPRPDATPSIELVSQPNLQVEADILFYKTYMALVMVDRADRWTATHAIKDRETATL